MNVEADMTAEMDESLATTLAANLLKNAFTHGNDGGRIRICLKARAMTIANTGGDRPLDGEKYSNGSTIRPTRPRRRASDCR